MHDESAAEKRLDSNTIYSPREAEGKWQAYWEAEGIYRFDPESSAPVFSIDTPPPTVSGDLHIGHVFSYTQAEIVARHMRMRGHNVFYPFGFDDNGLPTERLAERELGIRGSELPRREFIDACLKISARYELKFKELWKGLGFSVEWPRLYSTIDERSRRVSQRSFIDLYEKGLAYRKAAPTLFCPNCRTTVAQAEAEDRSVASRYITIAFELANGGRLPISTTRPELLPAIAAIFVHPEDGRYASLVGTSARDPLFGNEARIMADEGADPAKGSGAVMVCAFGDAADLGWFRKYGFEPKPIIGPDGKMSPAAGDFAGLGIKAARERVSAELVARGFAEAGPPIEHAVNVHERCGTELEFIMAEEWFIRILDFKDELERLASDIQWRPAYMKERYVDWVRNLRWDWCISRQRSYGLAFPLWYCASCGAVRLARKEELPVDPLASSPDTPCACGSREFLPERDVMDTWATSSVSPEINAHWGEKDDLSTQIQPFSLRPQAHDIIRTWAFYTIVKSYFHHGRAPWKEIMISGHSRDSSGAKISKSKGNAGVSPSELAQKFGADPIRYWAASAKLGTDSAFSEKTVADGRRLVLKLWNAGLLAEPFVARALASTRTSVGAQITTNSKLPTGEAGTEAENYAEVEKSTEAARARPIEAWIAASFRRCALTATEALDGRDYDSALSAAESFFRKDFCDDYLELCKPLTRRDGAALAIADSAEAALAAVTIYEAFYGTLRLFAPYLPHITEELYQRLFRPGEGLRSIHVAPWPTTLPRAGDVAAIAVGEALANLIDEIRKAKSAAKMSLAAPIGELRYAFNPERIPSGFATELHKALPRIGGMLKIAAFEERPWGSEPWATGEQTAAICATW